MFRQHKGQLTHWFYPSPSFLFFSFHFILSSFFASFLSSSLVFITWIKISYRPELTLLPASNTTLKKSGIVPPFISSTKKKRKEES